MESVSPALAPPPGNPRFPLADSIRGIAILATVGLHATFLGWYEASWGSVAYTQRWGVYAFFVLSGFLLYRPFVAARVSARAAPHSRVFARRRVLRIVPAFWVALTLSALVVGARGIFTGDWWLYYGLLQVYSDTTVQGGLGITWSLAVEASFYVVLPLYALVLARVARGRALRAWVRIELVALAGIALASVVAVALTSPPFEVLPIKSLSWLPANAALFAIGLALAVVSVALEDGGWSWRPAQVIERRPGACWAVALAALLATGLVVRPLEHPTRPLGIMLAEHALLVLTAACVVAPAVIGRDGGGLPRRVLASPVLAWLGVISYGLFLYTGVVTIEWTQYARHHDLGWNTGSLLILCGVLAIAVPLAWASYRVVELPFLRLKERRRGSGAAESPPPTRAGGTAVS